MQKNGRFWKVIIIHKYYERIVSRHNKKENAIMKAESLQKKIPQVKIKVEPDWEY
jgi:hypothetical protein